MWIYFFVCFLNFLNCPVEIKGHNEARQEMWQFHCCYGHCAIRAAWPHVGKHNEQHVCLLHQSAPNLVYWRDERKLEQGSRKWNEEHLSHGFWVPHPSAFNCQEFSFLRCLFNSCKHKRRTHTYTWICRQIRPHLGTRSSDLLLEMSILTAIKLKLVPHDILCNIPAVRTQQSKDLYLPAWKEFARFRS